MIRFTAADRAKAIQERSLEDFAKRSYKPVPESEMRLGNASMADHMVALDNCRRRSGRHAPIEPVPDTTPARPSVKREVRDPLAFERWFKASGLTLVAAAAKLGVSRPTIYAWRQKGAPDAVMAKLTG
jgi:hypothetical protein